MTDRAPVSRRTFLVRAGVGGASLLLGFSVAALRPADRRPAGRPRSDPEGDFEPNLWIRIDPAGDVHLRIHKCEMGQGVLTALPMLIAEELEVEWSRVRVEQADADFRFTDQNTSGSSSIIDTWTPLRQAGAIARTMLVRAAAGHWQVPESQCEARSGVVSHARSGRSAPYGELVGLARQITPPRAEEVPLKLREAFRLIGKPTRRLDAPGKVTGHQVYGIDVRVPGMLYASVLRCPVIGGKCRSMDDRRARAVPGVRHVVRLESDLASRLPERVAVVAGSTWAALQGRRALQIEWDEGPHASLSSAAIRRHLGELHGKAPVVVRDDGNVERAGISGPRAVAATYQVPYLAHAPMEPLNCTAHVRDDAIEIWAPTQFPQRAVEHVSRVTGRSKDAIRLHVIPMGGAFGRRAYPDIAVEAVQIARAVGGPVQTLWTRGDDIGNDFFRPTGELRLSAVLDRRGRPQGWLHCLTGPSIARHVFGTSLPPAITEVYAEVVPYSVPNVRVEYREAIVPVPLGVWRSVAQSHNVFAAESFIDELAHRTTADPVAYRRDLLTKLPRLQHVLDMAAHAAGWGARPPAGRGRGVAVCTYGEEASAIALVAEVSVDPTGRIQVHRLTCAVDCGLVVNPLSLRAQIEGGLIWGLSAALWSEITVEGGRIVQSNFHDYQVARLADAPAIAIEIVASRAPIGGIGEPSVALVAPAVANAVFAASGVRHRKLPMQPPAKPSAAEARLRGRGA